MTAVPLLADLSRAGIRLTVEGDNLSVKPGSALRVSDGNGGGGHWSWHVAGKDATRKDANPALKVGTLANSQAGQGFQGLQGSQESQGCQLPEWHSCGTLADEYARAKDGE